MAKILVVGAGITGLWQALTLARDGHEVRLIEASPEPFTAAASRLAGAMLAPFCESECTEPVIAELGIAGDRPVARGLSGDGAERQPRLSPRRETCPNSDGLRA